MTLRAFIAFSSATFMTLSMLTLSGRDVRLLTHAMASSGESSSSAAKTTIIAKTITYPMHQEQDVATPTRSSSSSHSSIKNTRPKHANIEVPFTSQAPSGDWSLPFQEACEEASLLMMRAFFDGTPLEKNAMEEDIRSAVAWHEQRGFGTSMTIDQTARMAREHFGFDAMVIDAPSVRDIENLIAEGHPVIVPAAGRMLRNPYFSNGGPWYHMLVVTGYDETHFIVNDPGTKFGEGYRYEKNAFMEAIHDWTGQGETILRGDKRILVVKRSRQ